ncbi:MAG: hypothetical protein C4575_11065 [Desulforudis sp.]|nr:MAG: hypothetical protein C4575_11065 [Desulforudis sp.]
MDAPTDQPGSYGPGVSADQNLISFENILRVVLRKRLLLIATFLLVFGTSLLVGFVLPPSLRVVSVILPPLPNNYELLDPEILSIDFSLTFKEGIFQEMYNNLNSVSLRRDLYNREVAGGAAGKGIAGDSGGIPDFETFNKALKVRRIEKDSRGKGSLKDEGVEVSYEGKYDPSVIAAWVNAFVRSCEKVTVENFTAKVRAQIDFKKEIVQDTITAIREKADLLKKDRLTLLEEAHKNAEKLGIHDEVVLSSYSDAPLYLRGTKSLSSEIANLKQREDNDLFADDLRLFQQQLFVLNQLEVKPDQFEAARVDSYALPEGEAMGPGRLFIIAFGFVAGLIIAFSVVLLVQFMDNIIVMVRASRAERGPAANQG